jgi:hypothetical protein
MQHHDPVSCMHSLGTHCRVPVLAAAIDCSDGTGRCFRILLFRCLVFVLADTIPLHSLRFYLKTPEHVMRKQNIVGAMLAITTRQQHQSQVFPPCPDMKAFFYVPIP